MTNTIAIPSREYELLLMLAHAALDAAKSPSMCQQSRDYIKADTLELATLRAQRNAPPLP